MNIYIYTDLEGITGVTDIDQVLKDNGIEGYESSRPKLMADVNAAVAGCFDGGAENVYVWDGHGGGENFIPGTLDPRAIQVPKSNMSAEMMKEWKIDAFMIVGVHAMMGTQSAFLDHTQSSKTRFECRINARPVGEIGQYAVYAGYYDIPIVMVSGDEATCQEARTFCGNIATAAVKYAVKRNTAIPYPDDECRRKIHDAAMRGMSLIGKIKPYKTQFPCELVTEYTRADYCDAVCERPDVMRIDARTAKKIVQIPNRLTDLVL